MLGPNVTNDPEYFLESDSAIEARKKRRERANYTQGNAIKLNSKALCMATDGKSLYVGESGFFTKKWDPTTRKSLMTYRNHTGPVSCLDCNGEYLASGSWDKSINIYNAQSGIVVATLKKHKDFVKSIKFIEGTDLLISCGTDNSIILWDVKKKEFVREINDQSVKFHSLCLFEDSFFVGCSEGSIRCYSLKDFSLQYTLKEHLTTVYDLFILNDSLYSSSADKIVLQWTLEERKWEDKYEHSDWPKCVKAKSNFLFTGCREGLLRIWDASNAKLLAVIDGHFDEISDVLVMDDVVHTCSLDGTVRSWNINDAITNTESELKQPEQIISAEEEAALAELMLD